MSKIFFDTMLRRVDHVAYVVDDLAESIGPVASMLGLDATTHVELPEYSLRAAFLGDGPVTVELIEFLSPEIAEARLGDYNIRLDHVAYEVVDIEHCAAQLREAGIRCCAPDGSELSEPLELGDARHLWTFALGLQLIERHSVAPSTDR